jgi:2-polyprenyl-6-hydroxyphenyl methylase/3-demethylubiquinone-9 3-methyltransferase
LGCAQGVIARELAQAGFLVTAVESNPDFLDYARTQDEQGQVRWVCSDIRAYAPTEPFDAAILAEVIEHTGRPHQLVEAAAQLLRPGGLLIVSTPNGDRLRQRLPTFSAWIASQNGLVDDAFGPAGEHHRFLFTRKELQAILAERFSEIRFHSISSVVQNTRTAPLLKWRLGRNALDAIEAALLATPLDGRCGNQLLVSGYRRLN